MDILQRCPPVSSIHSPATWQHLNGPSQGSSFVWDEWWLEWLAAHDSNTQQIIAMHLRHWIVTACSGYHRTATRSAFFACTICTCKHCATLLGLKPYPQECTLCKPSHLLIRISSRGLPFSVRRFLSMTSGYYQVPQTSCLANCADQINIWVNQRGLGSLMTARAWEKSWIPWHSTSHTMIADSPWYGLLDYVRLLLPQVEWFQPKRPLTGLRPQGEQKKCHKIATL